MNTSRRLFRTVVIGYSASVISSSVFAADDALRPIAFQNGVNQQALGTETADLAREITSLIEELQRNGFPVQSLSALTELAAQLNALGGTEMSAIAQRLRKLGENAQADPRATATEAYIAQQAIETRLKTLARQISIQQLREEAARRLESLITRQLAIQRETKAIASAKPNAERQRILESDQSGISEDLATFFQTGENLLARLRENDAPSATRAPDAAASAGPTFTERVNGTYLNTLSAEAVDHLKGKRYPDAYGRQEALIAELRKILQGILSSLPKEQRLASALQQVSALLQQQQANAQAPTPPTPQTNQQAADQAQNLANQVAPLSPEAAAALQQAQQALQNPPANQPQQNHQNPSAQQQAANQQQQPNTQQNNQTASTQPPATPPQSGQQPSQQSQPPAQPPQSAATAALTQAQTALQNALTQAQQQSQHAGQQHAAQPGQQPGQQQAGQQQQPGQPQSGQQPPNGQQQAGAQQPGQPQNGQNQQQGQPQQTAQTGRDGQSPNQQTGSQTSTSGDAQNQIAGHGPDSGDPAQVVGALRREEREAFTALQGERYPAEYSAWVQQYWRNLAQDQ